MGANQSSDSITVLCFGPLAEILGRTSQININSIVTVNKLLRFRLEEWLNNGLKIAINGEMCELDSQLSAGDELALLPPVVAKSLLLVDLQPKTSTATTFSR